MHWTSTLRLSPEPQRKTQDWIEKLKARGQGDVDDVVPTYPARIQFAPQIAGCSTEEPERARDRHHSGWKIVWLGFGAALCHGEESQLFKSTNHRIASQPCDQSFWDVRAENPLA